MSIGLTIRDRAAREEGNMGIELNIRNTAAREEEGFSESNRWRRCMVTLRCYGGLLFLALVRQLFLREAQVFCWYAWFRLFISQWMSTLRPSGNPRSISLRYSII
jgi:hypothetical protein